MALQHLRSSTAHKRPIPTVMSAGQIAINTNEASPALFFKDSNGDLVKVGPVHIGTDAPNSSPASVAATALVTGTVYQILTVGTSDFTLVGASANTVGTIFTATGTTTGTGTVSGQQGVEKGEMWLDTTGGTYVLKIYDGSAWRSESGTFVDVSGDTMTGDLVFNNADIVFEGATADDFETTLTVTDPTADRTIALPDTSGTVVTTGDTGSVTSTMILDGTIVNADVNASAAIAGTKIDPDFGSQNVVTTGTNTAASFIPTSSTVPTNGVYLPSANNVALATNGTGRLFVDSSGDVGIGTSSPQAKLQVDGSAPAGVPSLYLSRAPNINETSDIALSNNAVIRGENSIRNVVNNGGFFSWHIGGTDNKAGTAGASEVARIDSTGKVGIGTSSPGSALEIDAAAATSPFIAKINTSEAARIDSSGRLLVGTSSARTNFFNATDAPRLQLEATAFVGSAISCVRNSDNDAAGGLVLGKTRGTAVGSNTVVQNGDRLGQISFQGADGSELVEAAKITAEIDGIPGTDDMPGRLMFLTTAAGASSPTERMRIDSNGVVLFAGRAAFPNTNAITPLSGAKSIFLHSNSSTTTGPVAFESQAVGVDNRYHCVFGNGNGIVGSISTNASATAYTTSSDYRLKENVVPLTGAADRLNQLQVHRFNFIADPDKTVDGFLAHEAQSVVPECVTGTKDEVDDEGNPVYQGIDQSKLVPLLTAALQESLGRIETLETKVAALEAS